jgi:hypothetical protein
MSGGKPSCDLSADSLEIWTGPDLPATAFSTFVQKIFSK